MDTSRKSLLVGITSRSDESYFRWLVEFFRENVPDSEVKYLPITNTNRDDWEKDVRACSAIILYHTKHRGWVNITNVNGSLYDKELRYLTSHLGREKVVVLLDDMEDIRENMKHRILTDQPSLKQLASNLILIPERNKTEAANRKLEEFWANYSGGEACPWQEDGACAQQPDSPQTSGLPRIDPNKPSKSSLLLPLSRCNRSKPRLPLAHSPYRVGIFSRSACINYTWLMDGLKADPRLSSAEINSFCITNNYQTFRSGLQQCDFAILYHTKKQGRINITDVTNSLYDEELQEMSRNVGQQNVIVVVDDLESDKPEEKARILDNQPKIGSYAEDLFLFTETNKQNANNKNMKIREIIEHRFLNYAAQFSVQDTAHQTVAHRAGKSSKTDTGSSVDSPDKRAAQDKKTTSPCCSKCSHHISDHGEPRSEKPKTSPDTTTDYIGVKDLMEPSSSDYIQSPTVQMTCENSTKRKKETIKIQKKSVSQEETIKKMKEKSVSQEGTIKEQAEKIVTQEENIKKITEKSVSQEETIKKQAEKIVIQEENIKKITEKSVSQEETIKKQVEKIVTQEETIKKMTVKSVSQEETIKKITEKSVSQEQTIKKITEKSVSQEQTIKKITEKSVSQEETIKEQREKLVSQEETIKKLTEKNVSQEQTIKILREENIALNLEKHTMNIFLENTEETTQTMEEGQTNFEGEKMTIFQREGCADEQEEIRDEEMHDKEVQEEDAKTLFPERDDSQAQNTTSGAGEASGETTSYKRSSTEASRGNVPTRSDNNATNDQTSGNDRGFKDTEAAGGATEKGRRDIEARGIDMEVERGDKEKGRGDTEEGREGTEAGRGDGEAGRGATETGRVDKEAGRGETEEENKDAEERRGHTEAEGGVTENGRWNTEAGRGDIKAIGTDMEAGRGDMKTGRGDTDEGREGTETGRGDREAGRGNTKEENDDPEAERGYTVEGRGDTEEEREDIEAGRGDTAEEREDIEVGRGDTEEEREDIEVGRGDTEEEREDIEVGRGDTAEEREDIEAGRGDTEEEREDIEAGRGNTEEGRGDIKL